MGRFGYDLLYTAGPCALGAAVNAVLGRHPQTAIPTGTLDTAGAANLPGRTVVLAQQKKDMGAQRFTHIEKNLIVAATDLPGADVPQRDKNKKAGAGGGGGEAKPHYSDAQKKYTLYGLKGLYVDDVRADEDVRFVVRERATLE